MNSELQTDRSMLHLVLVAFYSNTINLELYSQNNLTHLSNDKGNLNVQINIENSQQKLGCWKNGQGYATYVRRICVVPSQ